MRQPIQFWLVLLCGCVSMATAQDSVTIYVSPAGKIGAAGTKAAPLKSIRAALEKAVPGTRVTLLEGLYNEAIAFPKSGEKDKPISLIAEGKVTIDVAGNKENPLAIVGRGVGFIVVEGIEVTGYEQGLKFKNCHDITVRRCKADKGRVGLSLEGSTAQRMIFEDVEVCGNEAGGVDVADGVAMEDVTFRRCSSHDNQCKGGNDGFGISHGCTTRNVLFDQCTAFNNGSDGFDISGKKGFGVTLTGCVSHHNGTKMWGANFKCWNPGSQFIRCIAYATGATQDGNFEAHGDNIAFIDCISGENADCGMKITGKNTKLVRCLFANATKKAVWIVTENDRQTGSLTAENCTVSGCDPGDLEIGRNGNAKRDVLFVDPANGDYHIKPGSTEK